MRKKAFLYIVLAGILWGTSGIFFNLLNPLGFRPLQMTAMRGIVSAVIMSAYVFIKDKSLFAVSKKELLIFSASGIAVFATASCYYAAIKAASVSVAVILMYTAPVFVMAYSVAFLGEKLNTVKLISVILMLAGCVLVSGVLGGARFSLKGVLLGLSAGIAYSAYNILTKIEMMHKSNSVSASLYCFISMAIVAAFAAPPSGIYKTALAAPVKSAFLITGIGVCTCILPYFLYTLALREIPVGTASALGIIEPMSATLLSVVFFGERLGAAGFIGTVLVLTAVFILNVNERGPEKPDNKKNKSEN